MRTRRQHSRAALQPDGLPPLREVAAAHGLAAKKSLGQNFIFDLNLNRRIARAAGPPGEASFIEIGPGPGGLTRALLAAGARKVIAIERDARCIPALAAIAAHYPGRLEIVEGDALEVKWDEYAASEEKIRVCANLPYNIATQLLIQWLETEPWPPWFDRLVLMFQREVAERIIATPLERAAYGRLSVLANLRCKTGILFDVPPAAFTPPPKIRSSLVELTPRASPLACSTKLLSEITQAAFGQRRKMLRQSLKSLSGADAAALLARADVDAKLRPEELAIAQFADLARALGELRSEPSG